MPVLVTNIMKERGLRVSARRTLPVSANHEVEEALKDMKECGWPKQLVSTVKSSTGKRLLGFYTPDVLSSLLVTLGEPKALGKITRLVVLFKAKFMDPDILMDTIYTFNCTLIVKDRT